MPGVGNRQSVVQSVFAFAYAAKAFLFGFLMTTCLFHSLTVSTCAVSTLNRHDRYVLFLSVISPT